MPKNVFATTKYICKDVADQSSTYWNVMHT